MSLNAEYSSGVITRERGSLSASQLLGGTKTREAAVVKLMKSEDTGVSAEDSGVMQISEGVQFTDDTTSVEEAPAKKPKRMPRRCKWCDNFSRGSTNLYVVLFVFSTCILFRCAKHGGGRRCHCGKLARGPSNLCMKHGGGRRCTLPNCQSASVYKSDFCRSHGGGKRCCVEGCVSSVYSMTEERCFKHGGGLRCSHMGCPKAPVGTTDFCIRHGGGRRCTITGCGKGAVCEGMCVKHHQEAYKVEPHASAPLKMITTTAIRINDDDEFNIQHAIKTE